MWHFMTWKIEHQFYVSQQTYYWCLQSDVMVMLADVKMTSERARLSYVPQQIPTIYRRLFCVTVQQFNTKKKHLKIDSIYAFLRNVKKISMCACTVRNSRDITWHYNSAPHSHEITQYDIMMAWYRRSTTNLNPHMLVENSDKNRELSCRSITRGCPKVTGIIF